MSVLEIVKWKAKPNVSNKKIIDAVNTMVPDLKKLKGFISQTLYKDEDDNWIDIYYWDTTENAHLSNERMADKESLKNLLELILLESVSMEVLKPLQNAELSN
ncbi:hypothetical protein [Aquimarina macrocephali]|uniref:hypothetical protein n=1 Tax=Aquimarina macrocephali TaxID=666563 RepID=UPI00046760BC|nr:hypothetical protein [Aquimarina macrocephali]